MSETVAVPRELLEKIMKKINSVEGRINKLDKMAKVEPEHLEKIF